MTPRRKTQPPSVWVAEILKDGEWRAVTVLTKRQAEAFAAAMPSKKYRVSQYTRSTP